MIHDSQLVSVITPVFNNEGTIAEAIESIQGQTNSNWELIVVDDGSGDRSREIALKYAEEDERIRVISTTSNRGSGHARNLGIARAQGELIAVLDADDISVSNRLEIQTRYMRENPTSAAVAGHVLEFGTWGGPLIARWPVSAAEITKRQRQLKMPIAHPAAMFRAEALKQVGGYDEYCMRAQDYAVMLKLRSQPVGAIDLPLVMYRTTRPTPVGYAVRSGRYAALARKRALNESETLPTLPDSLPKSTLTDLRSLAQWCRRRRAEMRRDSASI